MTRRKSLSVDNLFHKCNYQANAYIMQNLPFVWGLAQKKSDKWNIKAEYLFQQSNVHVLDVIS